MSWICIWINVELSKCSPSSQAFVFSTVWERAGFIVSRNRTVFVDSWGPSQVNYRLGFWDEKQGRTAAPLPEHRQETWLTHPPSTPYIGLTQGRSNALSKQPQRLIQQLTPRETLSLEPSSPWPSNTALHQQRTEYAIKAEINFHPYSYFSHPPVLFLSFFMTDEIAVSYLQDTVR